MATATLRETLTPEEQTKLAAWEAKQLANITPEAIETVRADSVMRGALAPITLRIINDQS